MAPLSAVSADLLAQGGGDAKTGGSRREQPKDWKELIDNGLAGGHSARQNRTVGTDNPTPSRAPSSGSDLIPLYCGLLGALICGLVLWIVLKQARRRRRDAKQPPADASSAAPLAPSQEADGDKCGRRQQLEDVSPARMRRLEQMLDAGSGWKYLAAELGYQPESVAEFEARAQLESVSAAGLLLHDWTAASATEGATVGDLRRSLRAAGLTDALPSLRDSAAERKWRPHGAQHPAAAADGDSLEQTV